MVHAGITTTVRGYARQAWRDLLSIYYANTPIWRWLKSGALLFFGVGLWAASSVVYSVTDWQVLRLPIAYGFLLIFWGPFTHMVVVPLTIRLRRNATGKLGRIFAFNSGKINLGIFFACVVILAVVLPGAMTLSFSPDGGDGQPEVSGELFCDPGEELVSCELVDPQNVDHVVVTSGDEKLRTVEEEPFTFELERGELAETGQGLRFEVELRDADGNTVRRFIERVTQD
jgi:hypothetical protein